MGTEQLGRISLDAARALEDYRIGKRHVIVLMIFMAVFDLVALGFILFLPTGHSRSMPQPPVEQISEPESPRLQAPEPEPEPVAPIEAPEAIAEVEPVDEPEHAEIPPNAIPDPAAREASFSHYVRWGDTFYSLARHYWGKEHLWPDLWLLNANAFPDPDFMVVGNVVQIFEPLGRVNGDGPREFSPLELDRIFEAYLAAYRSYRRIGEDFLSRASGRRSWYQTLGRARINKAHWALYSSLRYDEGFLERYRSTLAPGDIEVIEDYVERFGFPQSER